MELNIEGNKAVLSGKSDKRLIQFGTEIEGRKVFTKAGFSFEPTPHNLERFRAIFPEIPFSDPGARKEFEGNLPRMVEGVGLDASEYNPTYRPKTSAYDHQRRCYEKALDALRSNVSAFAILMEQGTGKTKVAIDLFGTMWCAREITAVLIITIKGVHHQWIDEAIPEHMGDPVPWSGWAWKKKTRNFLPEELTKNDKLRFLSINIDAIKSSDCEKIVHEFIRAHNGRVFCIIDESNVIQNAFSARSKKAREIGMMCRYRMIMTGTPIAKNLTDEWAQFLWLDERIIGHRYLTTFKKKYCVTATDKDDNEFIVGSKNEIELFGRLEPYQFRVTKEEELDLPPKVYDKVYFELSNEQWKHYSELREKFLTELENGTIATVANAAVLMTRLQQITCGYIVNEDREVVRFKENPRLETLNMVRGNRSGKKVIWCRYNDDIAQIMESLGGCAVSYWGGTSDKDRKIAKERIIEDPTITDIVANPSAMGTGTDGLQKVIRTSIYYSNSFNYLHRAQSEDRTHRIGMKGTCLYIDLIARRSVDLRLLKNLAGKKSLSDLMLDDIRKMLITEEAA